MSLFLLKIFLVDFDVQKVQFYRFDSKTAFQFFYCFAFVYEYQSLLNYFNLV